MRYPNVTMAAMSKMSLKEFEDFYFEACLLDYRKMGAAMSGLQKLMEKTDRVKIIAPDTHLEFSIKGIPAVKSEGKRNIPDGEVYTAPVKVRLTVMCSLTPTAPITVRYFRASGWNLRTDGL